MSKAINSVVNIKILINAISTIIMHRHSIVMTFPLLLKHRQERGWLINILIWSGMCIGVFVFKIITHNNRFKPAELVKNLKKTNHRKVALERNTSNYLSVIKTMQSDSLIFEYIVSNGIISFFLNYLSLMKLVKQSAQIALTGSISVWRNILSNRLLPCLIACLSSVAVLSNSYIELEEKKDYQELERYLKNNTYSEATNTTKKQTSNVWYESNISQYICYSLLILLVLTPNSKFLFGATLLSTYKQLALGLVIMQGLKMLFTQAQISYAKIYSSYIAFLAVITAGSSLRLIMKQDYVKILSPLAQKIGVVDFNNHMYNLVSACQTVFLWTYGISLYRVVLHNSYVKSIALEVKKKVYSCDENSVTTNSNKFRLKL